MWDENWGEETLDNNVMCSGDVSGKPVTTICHLFKLARHLVLHFDCGRSNTRVISCFNKGNILCTDITDSAAADVLGPLMSICGQPHPALSCMRHVYITKGEEGHADTAIWEPSAKETLSDRQGVVRPRHSRRHTKVQDCRRGERSRLLAPGLVRVLHSALVQARGRPRDDAGLAQETAHRVGRLRAHREPVLDPIEVEAQVLVAILTCSANGSLP